jgi:hypothetical protein
MLHLNDVLELLLLLVFTIAKCHARQDVFLDVLEVDLARESRVWVIVVGGRLSVVDLEILVLVLIVLIV